MHTANIATLLADVGESIEDVAEETFILFSQNLPHNDLGIIDDKADEVQVLVNGHEYSIAQSSGLLRSARVAGTTGAMVWKVTPRIAQWLTTEDSILWRKGILNGSSNVLELGCGVAGVIGMALSPLVSSYVLTDQVYVLKLLRENIACNSRQSGQSQRSGKKTSKSPKSRPENLFVHAFDWEDDSVQNIKDVPSLATGIDVVIICDCIYNSYLIEPLTQACVDVCGLGSRKPTVMIIAQQLRTDDVFEEWLTRFIEEFQVWRIKDELLPLDLQSTSGYVVHLALSRRY